MVSLSTRARNWMVRLDPSHTMPLRLDAPIATFTFDDFPVSAYSVAGRMIERADAHATYFASAEFMGRTIDGVAYYDAALLKDIHAAGHEIGCHSHDHVSLPLKGPAFAQDSSRRNADALLPILGEDVRMCSFAYPYGDVSLGVKHAMKQMFPICRGVRQQLNKTSIDLGHIGIVSLEARHWNRDRMAATIAEAVRAKAWMVFLTHDISDDPMPYGSTPDMIATTLNMVQDAGVEILTLKAAAARAAFAGHARALAA